MSISVESLRELLANRRDMVLSALKQILLADDPDPFQVSWKDFLALSEDERIALTRRAHALREDQIESEFVSSGAKWLVMAGDRVVSRGTEIDACPDDDEIDRVGRETGKVPYLFTRLLVEELRLPRTPWHPLAGGDAYPSIRVHVSEPAASDDALFTTLSLAADLDTGSPVTFVPWEEALRASWPATSATWRKDRHLGIDYEWLPCRARVGVTDSAGKRRSVGLVLLAVRGWGNSPFTRVHANRQALVGRNLLLALGLRVLLLAETRETEVPGS